MKGSFRSNGGGSAPTTPIEIKFYPNPTTSDWVVDRNSDSATDGSGNTGSLRYCMTNGTAGQVIIFNATLTDTANTGNTNIINILSTLPSKYFNIYGNNITISSNNIFNYNIFSSVATDFTNIYSLHFNMCFFSGNYTIIYNSYMNFYGCKFENIGLTYPMTTYKCRFTYCNFKNIKGGHLSNVSSPEFFFCNFENMAGNGSLGNSNILCEDCYINDSYNALNNNNGNGSGVIFRRCYKIGSISNWMEGIYENNIFVNCQLGVNFKSNATVINNTFINITPIAYIFGTSNLTAGLTCNLTIKNNLFICPTTTVLISTVAPIGTLNVVEDYNIYMAVNIDTRFTGTNTVRHTGLFTDIISLNENKTTSEGNKKVYFTPKGIALNFCPKITGVDTDYLGKTRGDTTDCGAIDTEGI